jgi:hypothetical protein
MSRLARTELSPPRSGRLSRSVRQGASPARFPVPPGTDALVSNRHGAVVIAVHDQPALGANMGPNGEAFPDAKPTARTLLARGGRRDGYDGNVVYRPIVAHPPEKQPPTGVVNTFSEVMILDHVTDVQMFVGNQVA